MNLTKDVEDEVLPELRNYSGESIKESKPGSQATPEQYLQLKEDDSPRTVHGFKWVLVCVSLYVGGLLYGLDTTIAADIQAAIVERFDSVERLTWVGTAFPLGSVCAVLPT
jgi:hypothetical protein